MVMQDDSYSDTNRSEIPLHLNHLPTSAEVTSFCDSPSGTDQNPLAETVSPLHSKSHVKDSPGLVDIGFKGTWTVSSAKHGNGVRQLRDGNLNTVWQSDGAGPHAVTIHFRKRTKICRLDMFIDQSIDESYTPSVVAIHAGSCEADLECICEKKFEDPRGWQTVELQKEGSCAVPLHIAKIAEDAHKIEHMLDCFNFDKKGNNGSSTAFSVEPVYPVVFCIQIEILQNHQAGQDCHIRQVRLLGPKGENEF